MTRPMCSEKSVYRLWATSRQGAHPSQAPTVREGVSRGHIPALTLRACFLARPFSALELFCRQPPKRKTRIVVLQSALADNLNSRYSGELLAGVFPFFGTPTKKRPQVYACGLASFVVLEKVYVVLRLRRRRAKPPRPTSKSVAGSGIIAIPAST